METDKPLQFDGRFPILITPLEDDEACTPLVADNHATIALLDLLETAPQVTRESDRRDPVMQELLRLEHKLDLVLSLLARQQGSDATAMQRNRLLGRDGLFWQGEHACREGQAVRVALYPEPACPQPLVVCARVRQCDSAGGELRFEQLDEETEDWLARFLFRQHRRQVAEARARRDRGEQG